MAYKLNKKLEALEPYEPISGEYKIRLDANESFLQPDDNLKVKIMRAVSEVGFNRYPDPTSKKLISAFARAYGVNEEVVVAGNGSDELISVITNSFLQKGEKVMTLKPDFSMYSFYCSGAECENVVFNKDGDFKVDVDALINAVNESGARMLIFSNPCNPTSVGFPAEDMRKLVASTDALVVLDEAYMDFWNESLITETENYDNLIVLKTCSKALGFAAARLGFAVSNPVITRALDASRSPYNVNSLSQAIGCAVLSDRAYIDGCIEKIIKSKRSLYEMLLRFDCDDFRVIKSDTNFIYIVTENAKEIFEELKKRSIIIRCFKGALRITAGTKEENESLIKALDEILKKEEKR